MRIVEKYDAGFQITAQRLQDSGDPQGFSNVSIDDSLVEVSVPNAVVRQLGPDAVMVVATFDGKMVAPGMSGKRDDGGGNRFEFAAQPIIVKVIVGGEARSVKGLDQEPILIQLLANASAFPGALCVYWDEMLEHWSGAGIESRVSSDGALVCATTHLTIFAAIMGVFEDVLDELRCTNIRIFSSEAVAAAREGEWARTSAGALVWALAAGCVISVLGSAWRDQQVCRSNLWRDDYLILYLPEHQREAFGVAKVINSIKAVHRSARSVHRSLCRLHCSDLCTWVPSLPAKTCEAVALLGVHSRLSCRHHISVNTMRQHLWGHGGYVHHSPAGRNSEQLSHLLDQVRDQVPKTFAELYSPRNLPAVFCMTFCGMHPLASVFHLDLQQSSAKRAKLLFDALIGAVVVSALFLANTGSLMTANSPRECVVEDFNAIRYFLFAIASCLLVKLPLGIVSMASLRGYVHHQHDSPDDLRHRHHRNFRIQDALFWNVSLVWTAVCLAYLVIFVANLHKLDHPRFLMMCITVVLRAVLVWPTVCAFFVTIGIMLTCALHPEFARSGSWKLGLFLDKVGEVHPKVHELAHRGISVQDLLDFYSKLGSDDMFPHFDPDASTTHDVVRHAVIPLSLGVEWEGGGAAYATVLNKGEPRMANKMVTHNWGNKFSHLLAAVFADCMGHRTYDHALGMLVDKGCMEELREQLRTRAHRRYWICAFSVNQHSGICDKPPLTDSHGRPLNPCSCSVPKYLTGDPCEMNKFDDMMAYLLTISPAFSQVIAVDSHFVLFSRIWCIAELLEARRDHIPQDLEIHSVAHIVEHRKQLDIFDVQDAQASFPADRELILSKVDDPVQFNKEMRELVLHPEHGLLSVWSSHVLATSMLVDELGSILALATVDGV
mmetsp:Transcript_17418/g.56346  ORF Transcript_17418/g.56346 Transcript_17418/m.56346 type:complete len:890 (-) Transcript_17418:166-2835(-)